MRLESKGLPLCPERLPEPSPRKGYAKTLDLEIRVLNYLAGGGVEPKAPDRVTAVRGSSVRGHLRFWWRATRGGGFATYGELFKEESRIWGNTEKGSPVVIAVSRVGAGQRAGDEVNRQELNLVYFGFQDHREEILKALRFQLRVDFPEDLRDEVETALKAWLNFGGLGSRTRRGSGALYCREFAPSGMVGLEKWWADLQMNCSLPTGSAKPWPTLPRTLWAGKTPTAPEATWLTLLQHYRDFRQKSGFARGVKPNGREGRSHWPEADSLRAQYRIATPGHGSSTTLLPSATPPGFPRAALGLPIVFHFPLKKGLPPHPQDAELNGTLTPAGKEHERMGSPLILRPLVFPEGQSIKAVPILLALATERPVALKYTRAHEDWKIPVHPDPVERPDLATYRGSPMARLSPNGDAVQAAIGYLKNHLQLREMPGGKP